MIRFLPMLLAVPSFAASVSYSAAAPGAFGGAPSFATTSPTNWNQTLALPLFNPILGSLNSVTLQVLGGVYGNVRLENEDASAAAISYTLAAQVTATGLSGITVVVLPAASGTFNASVYDGTTDFGGTSGTTFSGLFNTASNATSSSVLALLAAYTGAGTFNVNVAASGTSSSSGSGNWLSGFNTRAGALVTVTYDYDAPIQTPEPASFVLAGAGLIAAGLFRRRN